MKKTKATKAQVLKKGKEVFGSTFNFNMWLNTDNTAMDCKPVDLWEKKGGLQLIFDELGRIEHGILA